MEVYNYKNFKIESRVKLSQQQITELLEQITSSKKQAAGSDIILAGRGAVSYCELEGLGVVAIKKYVRGGLFGKLIKNYHLRSHSSRPLLEFEALELAKKVGVKVPKPLVAISKGKFFYQSWLVMEKIEYQSNLADLSQQNPEAAFAYLPEVIKVFNLLIDQMIYHPDLHPGNFLITNDNQLYLIDFDKAGLYQGLPSKLREDYLLRWRRAIIKYDLPDFLTEHLAASLRAK